MRRPIYRQLPTTSKLEGLPSGVAGTRHTLKRMAGFARSEQGKLSPEIRHLSMRLVAHCPPKNEICEIINIHRFVRDKIRYIKDIDGVETLTTPEKTLETGAGDCDDKSTLIAAMLGSIGYKTRFVAVGPMPKIFTHVLAEVYSPKTGRWLALETTEPVKAGWYPKRLKYRLVEKI